MILPSRRIPGADAGVVVVGLACAGLSILVLLSHALGWTPPLVAIPLVAIAAAVGLRCLLAWSGRSATATTRVRVAHVLAWSGIAVALGSLALALPNLTKGGGVAMFAGNVILDAWPLLLIGGTVIAIRTMGWMSFAGAFFTGFFAVTGLATLIGHGFAPPGTSTELLSVVVAPVSEELLKALPVGVLLLLAVRNTRRRPSAGDAVLFGAALSAGFALYEDALYARTAGPGWGANPPMSLLFPSVHTFTAGMFIGGHIVWTGMVALGLAAAVLYGRRVRLAWLAAPVTLVVAVLEHMTANQLAAVGLFDSAPGWTQLTKAITLGGYLSFLLLFSGFVAIVVIESRALRCDRRGPGNAASPALRLLLPSATELARRGAALAALQTAPRSAKPAAPAAMATGPTSPPPPPPPAVPA